MSLGSGASSTLDSAVNNLINRGITVVVAAGNSSASACNYSPARVPAAITVAASTINDQLASFSNYGSCVDLIAPGSSITSAWYTSDGASASLNGTSMASPHVAGAAVTLFANGFLSPANIGSQLKSIATGNLFTSLPSGTPNLLLYTNTGGTVVTPPPTLTVPTAPSNLLAEPAKRSAQLSWQLAENDGGSPITSQIITVISGGKTVKTVTTTGTATAATIRSLNTRLSYTFTVSAINSVGPGPASAPSNAITPLR
jgi:subtilisin family serine protease